jgi:lysophospholipase L1-like esterase
MHCHLATAGSLMFSHRYFPPQGVVLALIAVAGFAGCSEPASQQAGPPTPLQLATTPAPLEETWSVEWWIPRHEEKLAARDPGIELVMIGDSITHGWEDPGKAVWERHFADVDTLNLGFSGDRTENVLWRLEHGEVEGLSPDLVVMMIGTNNTGHRMDPPEAIAAGIRKILGELESRLPGTPVLLLAIFPRGETPEDPMRVNNEQTNRLLEKLAAEAGVEFADFNAAFLTETGVLEVGIMPDLLHPNEAGYEIWARQLDPWLAEYLEGG